jgi:hypothetical protein
VLEYLLALKSFTQGRILATFVRNLLEGVAAKYDGHG